MIAQIQKKIAKIRRMSVSRGFGIQSPWAYHMMVDVIASRQPYDDYERLSKLYSSQSKIERQHNELCYRLARRIKATAFVDTAVDTNAADYVKAGSPQAEIFPSVEAISTDKKQAVLYRCFVLHDMLDRILNNTTPGSVLIADGIRDSKWNYDKWIELRDDPRCGITFDLYDIALIFFDPNITKQNYSGPVF